MKNLNIFGFALMALFTAGAVACGGDDDEPTAAAGETPRGDDDSLTCAACGGEEVCIASRCEAAFPRFYSIRIGKVTFPMTKATGGCWDEPGCGAPDPQVKIRLNGEEVGEFEFADDLFEATFADEIDVQILAGSQLEISLEDEEIVGSEGALVCEFNPLTAETIREGDLSCEGSGATIEASIRVRGETNGPG